MVNEDQIPKKNTLAFIKQEHETLTKEITALTQKQDWQGLRQLTARIKHLNNRVERFPDQVKEHFIFPPPSTEVDLDKWSLEDELAFLRRRGEQLKRDWDGKIHQKDQDALRALNIQIQWFTTRIAALSKRVRKFSIPPLPLDWTKRQTYALESLLRINEVIKVNLHWLGMTLEEYIHQFRKNAPEIFDFIPLPERIAWGDATVSRVVLQVADTLFARQKGIKEGQILPPNLFSMFDHPHYVKIEAQLDALVAKLTKQENKTDVEGN